MGDEKPKGRVTQELVVDRRIPAIIASTLYLALSAFNMLYASVFADGWLDAGRAVAFAIIAFFIGVGLLGLTRKESTHVEE